ncbi:hypothetical protein ACFVHR_04785 [Streptomyces sp. NPDC127168]|uniref:hypothetical protein n=1 Tax=unclassified Streptomyces TaxID=2593676 RepID=UPI003636F5C7
MTEDYDSRKETCPDCQATEDNMDVRTIGSGTDKETGRIFVTTTWHLRDCPAYTVTQILMEDSARRAKEQTERERKEFPAAQARFIRAVASGKFDDTAMPFVEALGELIDSQGEDLGRFVALDRWVDILNRHFPPDDQPTA